MKEMLDYFSSIRNLYLSKDASEASYRSSLEQLFNNYKSSEKINVIQEAKREGKFGTPDFKILFTESVIGYAETKIIGVNIDKVLKSEQIKKYQQLSDNLLVTNYLDWIWIKAGEIQKRETLCYITDIESKKAKLDKTKAESVEKLIKGFLSQAPKEIADAKKLAEALAIRAKLLKDFLFDELCRQQEADTEGKLFQLFKSFRDFIFQEITISEFSDAFAQNLVYGLFLAKLNADTQTINLYNAKKFIPASFELIKELVNFLNELDNDEYRETRWIVEEVLTIMNNLDLPAIQDSLSFTKRRKDANNFTIKDPYVYFYENFLAAYDKKLRESKGVYYTPPPVVNFIVRAIDDILKDTFKIKEGLGDKNKVTVLDFATGTGTFLVEMLQQIFEKLPKDSGKKDLIIKEHVLKNIFGFEYLIAPYTIAHLKLSQFLKDNGYELKAKERLQIYLTNTLEPIPKQTVIRFFPALTEEVKKAQQVKDKPILVITGNPPYSGHSKNNGAWITDKIKDYYFVDGKPLGEKNPKWLQDDYVKFIRFAQDKMETVEEGVVGIITNHRFLTNPTFRGMRQSLMKTFDQIYLIDLHGSNKPKEFAPDGGKDENVFDIEQGVAISLFVKRKGIEKKIMHTDFWGTRIEKYQRSLEEDLKSIDWEEVKATAPFYLFTPQDENLKFLYESGISVTDIFKLSSVGVVTSDDETVRDFIVSDLIKKVKIKYSQADSDKVKKLCSSPFDNRYIYYDKLLLERAREKVMNHFVKDNFALVCSKQVKSDFKHVFISDSITIFNFLDKAGSFGSGFIFPKYIFVGEEKIDNIEPSFSNFLGKLSYKPNYQDAFGYIYAILHSPTYRNKYAEFLKIDFPRIPFTEDKKVFKQLSELGNELINAHLLKEEHNTFVELIGKGDSIVVKPNYVFDKKTGKLFINKTQYFQTVSQQVYDFYIGGYQVLDKYLKDRKGRELKINDLNSVANICKAITFTIEQIKKIDKYTQSWI